jgi:ubiquinone biosynthesis protein COQ4
MARRRPARIRPIEAFRALRALLADPDDTSQVFRLLRATSGRSFRRLYRRVRRDPQGARILDEAKPLVDLLNDRAYLASLEPGTLGRAYLDFVEAEQISADGLAAASAPMANEVEDLEWDPMALRFGERLRDMHDLWHVVTGYNRDILGELALLAFTFEQTREPGLWLIVWAARRRIRKGGAYGIDHFVADASRRGRGAAFLPAADWEALLEQPLEDVRRELRVGAPAEYEQRRSEAGERAARAAAL